MVTLLSVTSTRIEGKLGKDCCCPDYKNKIGESIVSRKDIKLRRKEKINHILATATKVFAEKGYAGASTNEIADMAGISKRTMYYYIGDKDTQLFQGSTINFTTI
jgi:hypothetical protein